MSDQIKPIEEIEETETEAQSDGPDFDNMSDEEFLSLDPSASGIGSPDLSTPETVTLEERIDAKSAEAPQAEDEDDTETEAGTETSLGEETADPVAKDAGTADAGEAGAKVSDTETGKETTTSQEAAPNFEELYKQVMKPFKANGKEITPASPDEAIRLMQMGANYTRKMQVLAPNLKMMRMLENNGLLDESKLSFLIDLDRKDPKAIQKLLHDGKIDPLDLDVSSEPAYTPGNHAVSDQEMAFHTTLGDVMSTPEGKETVSHINSQWDQDSKKALYREPQLLAIIDTQRANGLYAKISSEIDRRRMLGDLQNIPFIAAYKQVGDELHAQGKLIPESAPAPVQAPRPVLDTRAAKPKPTATNGDKARAVSAAPSAGKASAPVNLDPFSMSDEEIMRLTSLKV